MTAKRITLFCIAVTLIAVTVSSSAFEYVHFGKRGSGWRVAGYSDLSTTGNVTLDSTQDGDMVVAEYGNVTINAGHTLTVANRCKGLKLIVHGDLVVSGTISMTARGASAAGADVPVTDPFGSEGTLYTVPAAGAAGGTGNDDHGDDGTDRKTGGGGTGLAYSSSPPPDFHGGAGTSYSGGAGASGYYYGGDNGDENGGPGGDAPWSSGGGAGNPGGTAGGGTSQAGEDGTGGLLIILVKGNITINSGGIIESDGSDGGIALYNTGGGSGGGSINISHGGSYTNDGAVHATGGTGGYSGTCGKGGDGCVTVDEIESWAA